MQRPDSEDSNSQALDAIAAPTAATFNVLGEVRATIDGRAIALGGPRQRALLCLLLINVGHSVSADQLADELWAREPPDGASVTLRSYVSRLRAVLGHAASISGSSAGYRLDVEAGSINSVAFERLVRSADELMRTGDLGSARQGLVNALALWHGRPFADLADDGLLRLEADRLEQLHLHALERRIEADIDLGDSAAVVDEVEAAAGRHPYRERLWQLVMLALYHSGRQADALAAFRRARKLLDAQLGLDPSPGLAQLEQQILRHEVPPIRGKRERLLSLPTDVTTFVGRETDIDSLTTLIGQARLVTLTGVGGVGKTRLAIEAARRSSSLASDGAVFVDLAPTTRKAEVHDAVARAVGVREASATDPLDAAVSLIAHARLLILLDNCEHVAEVAAEVARRLVSECDSVHLLATSRAPLGLHGEHEFAVAPLALPPVGADIDALRTSEAVRLLLERVSATRSGSPEDDATLIQAARICRDLDGIPLAIELAAARAKALSLTEIAGHLDDRFQFLVSWRRVSAARHQTLRQAMDWSYDLLSPPEQELFASLSVFAGGFTLEGARAVRVVGDANSALELVERLVDASLVIAEVSSERARYRMLETVREYAGERLSERGATATIRDTHADYFAKLSARAEPELTGANQLEWFAILEAERDNFRAALSHLADKQENPERLLEFTVSLTRFWYVRGHLSEAREQLDRGLQSTTGAPAALRRRALTAAASVALLQGDYTAATDFAEQSLAAARTTGEERLVANGLSNLGAILLASGERERSGALLQEAVAVARSVGDTRILALALNNLGDHALTIGDYQRAEPLFAESLALLRERGDTANVARSLFNQGAVALRLGRTNRAEELLRESLVTARSATDKEDICWALVGHAALALARDEPEQAATLLGAATALLEQMGAAFKPFERTLHDDTAAGARSALGVEPYEVARSRGAAMTMEDAMEHAVGH